MRYLCLHLDGPSASPLEAFPEFSTNAHVGDVGAYQGGLLVAGLSLGVGTTALSVHEVRTKESKEIEIVTLAASEFEQATAGVIAAAILPYKDLDKNFRIFAEPAGDSEVTLSGALGGLRRLGVNVQTPEFLRDVQTRTHTVRGLLAGEDVRGNRARYVCGNSGPELLWLAECLEQASWPTARVP